MSAQRRTRHRKTTNEGWDNTIVKAPDSQRSGRHKRHRRKRWAKVVIGIVVALLVVIGAAVAAIAWYMNSLNSSMSLGEATDEIKANLAVAKENQPFYILVMGLDMREGEAADRVLASHADYDAAEGHGSGEFVKSDTIMLVRIDTLNSKVTLLTVPRDYPYTFEDGKIRKLNSSYVFGGAPGVINAVSDLTGLEISHYVEVRGSELVELVDGLGGITVNVPMTFDYNNIAGERVHLDEGLQHVNGDQALALAGMRVLYSGTNRDVKRQTAGRQVVEGIMDAVLSQPAVSIPGTVADAASCVKTDLSASDILDLARKMGGHATVYTGTGPNDGDIDPYVEGESEGDGNLWLCYVNTAGWERVIQSFTSGEDIDEVSYKKDVVHYAGQPKDTWSKGLVEPEDLD